MIQVFKKELNSFLNSLIAYVVIGVFLTSMGLMMWVFTETAVLDYGFADMDTLFSLGPYVFIFLVPAITMKSFAEEKKMGTMELLLTKPLSDWNILLLDLPVRQSYWQHRLSRSCRILCRTDVSLYCVLCHWITGLFTYH
jgi:hypothetical protein